MWADLFWGAVTGMSAFLKPRGMAGAQMLVRRWRTVSWRGAAGAGECPFMGLGSFGILGFWYSEAAPTALSPGRRIGVKQPLIHYTGWEKAIRPVYLLFSMGCGP